MGILTNLRDRFLVQPVAEKILGSLKKPENNMPAVTQVPYGFNSTAGQSNKLMTSGGVAPQTLRALSVNHEVVRAAINARKRQITQLEFEITEVDPDGQEISSPQEKQALKDRFSQIGGPEVRFRDLLSTMIEDILVLDGLVYYKQRTVGGKLLRIIPVDPATIKMLVDDAGSKPLPPDIAYEQWLYGKKVAELTTDDLTYRVMNPRTNSPYGLSPLESLLMTVDTSLRAALYNSNYLSDNNIPMGFLNVPDGWTVQQIKEYKEWFDSMLVGSKNTSKVFPVPAGTNYTPASKPTDFAFKDFNDYLDRKVLMLFDVTPQEVGLNLQQYKENAEQQDEIGIRRGLKPLANFLMETFTDIIRYEWGNTNYCFKFTGYENKFSTEDLKSLVPLGVIGVDEARADLSLPKIGVGNMVMSAGQVIPLNSETNTSLSQTTISGSDTTVSGTEDKQTTPPGVPPVTPDSQPINGEKLAKLKKKRPGVLTGIKSTKKYAQFKTEVREALTKQLKPFTQQTAIANILSSEKADFSFKDHIENYFNSIEFKNLDDYLGWALNKGWDKANKKLVKKADLSATFDITNPRIIDYLKNRKSYLIKAVNQATKDYLVNVISSGKDDGLTNSEIAYQIEEDMAGSMVIDRADLIVATEVASAMGKGEIDNYLDQGIEEKQWVTAGDTPCEFCQGNEDEGPIPVDDSFETGDDSYPAHPNCECYINPVFSND